MALLADMSAFVRSSLLDQEGFYAYMEDAGCGNLSKSPFASIVFNSFSHGQTTVDVGAALAAMAVFTTFAELSPVEGFDREMWKLGAFNPEFPKMMMARNQYLRERLAAIENEEIVKQLGKRGMTSWRKERARLEHTYEMFEKVATGGAWTRYLAHNDPNEIFNRYSTSGHDHISHGDLVMQAAVVTSFHATFAEFVGEGTELSMGKLMKAIDTLQFGSGPRELPVYLFARFKAGNGELKNIDVWEFATGCARMIRPVAIREQAEKLPGWPGLPCLHEGGGNDYLKDLKAFEDTLQTGDVLIMSLTDDTARYFNFVTNTIWTHAAVVLKHKPASRPGVPNLETEELLKDANFRWRTHRFCTPRYCRCYAPEPANKPMVELLEATGQGVHVYDLPTRLLFGWNASRTGTLAVRRLRKAPGRDNDRKVEHFIRQVRGHLYQVRDDDGLDSMFCSQLVTAFSRSMGWLGPTAGVDTAYMPSDYADGNVPLADGVEWGDLELIRNQWTSTKMPLQYDPKVKTISSPSRIRPSRL